MEYIFKSSNLRELDQLKEAILNEIPCYRITDLEVIQYNSTTPLDTFIEKIKYIPLPEVQSFINTEIDNNPINNEIISLNKESNSYNQGNLNISFKITKGTRKDNPFYNSIKSIQWIPEEGVLKVIPNIDYEGNIEIITKLDQLSSRYPDIVFPELRIDTELSYINRIIDHMKWVPYLDKIYLLIPSGTDKIKGTEGIFIALVCPNATEDEEKFIISLLHHTPTLTKISWDKISYKYPDVYKDSNQITNKKVLLYSRDKDIDQNKEYGNYEIFESNFENTLEGYSERARTYHIEKSLSFIGLLKYLPFVNELYYAKIEDSSRSWQYYSVVLFCSNVTKEEWGLLDIVSNIKSSRMYCYRGDELIEGGVIMKQFNNTKILLARRS